MLPCYYYHHSMSPSVSVCPCLSRSLFLSLYVCVCLFLCPPLSFTSPHRHFTVTVPSLYRHRSPQSSFHCLAFRVRRRILRLRRILAHKTRPAGTGALGYVSGRHNVGCNSPGSDMEMHLGIIGIGGGPLVEAECHLSPSLENVS